MQHGDLRTDRCPWFIDKLFKLSYTYISDISTAGSSNSHIASRINKKWDRRVDQQKPKTNHNGDDETVRRNPLRDLPEEFWDNLLDESVPARWDAPASSSRESASEPLGKVVSGKHSICTHFPKDRNCDICMRTKITRAPCRKTHWRSRTSSRKCWWLDNSRTQSFQCMLWISKQSLIRWRGTRFGDGFNLIRAKLKLLRKQKRAYQSSSSGRGNQKSFTLTIPKILAKLVKMYPGVIVRQHLTVQKQMGLLRERYAGLKKGLLLYCCNQVCVKNGGRIPWSVTAICETYKDLLSDRRFGEPFKGPISPLVEDLSRLHQFGKKVLPGIFFVYVLYAGWIRKGDIFVADI